MVATTMCAPRGRLLLAICAVLFVSSEALVYTAPGGAIAPVRTHRAVVACRRFSHPDARAANVVMASSGDEVSPPTGIFDLPPDVAKPFSLLLFAQFVLFIGVGAVIPTLPIYGKSIGLTGATNGIVIAAPALALLLGAQPAGRYADRARKPAMLLGMAVIALADLGTALSASLAPLIVARLGLGAGRCISESGERGMLADFASRVPALRGRALAAQQATLALGIAIGAPLGGIAVDVFGPRAAFLCVSAAATVTLGLYALLPESITESAKAAPAPAAADDASSNLAGLGSWAELLRDRRWRGLCAVEVGARFGYAAKIASIPILATSAFRGGASAAGLLVSAAGLSGLIGAPAGGWLTDRRGARTTALASGLFSGLSLMLVPVALGSPSHDMAAAAFAGLVVLWSIGASAQGPSLTAIGQLLAPAGGEAEALALPRAAGDAVFVIAPFVLGSVADMLPMVPGAECAVAGAATLLGVLTLAALVGEEPDLDDGTKGR